MTTNDQPFDQSLYDAVMADKMDHALGVPSLATEYSDGYDSGYHHAALTAAIASPLPQVPGHVHRFTVRPVGDGWWCWATQDIDATEARSWVGKGDNPFDALRAAIAAAKEAAK